MHTLVLVQNEQTRHSYTLCGKQRGFSKRQCSFFFRIFFSIIMSISTGPGRCLLWGGGGGGSYRLLVLSMQRAKRKEENTKVSSTLRRRTHQSTVPIPDPTTSPNPSSHPTRNDLHPPLHPEPRPKSLFPTPSTPPPPTHTPKVKLN